MKVNYYDFDVDYSIRIVMTEFYLCFREQQQISLLKESQMFHFMEHFIVIHSYVRTMGLVFHPRTVLCVHVSQVLLEGDVK